jgi:hypothetical protein
LLPFAFTAVAVALTAASARIGRRAALGIAGVLVASNLYLYPLATGVEVPAAAYRPVLGLLHLVR